MKNKKLVALSVSIMISAITCSLAYAKNTKLAEIMGRDSRYSGLG